jgi:hypothetical protein
MRYLVEVPNFGEFAAPGVFAEVRSSSIRVPS